MHSSKLNWTQLDYSVPLHVHWDLHYLSGESRICQVAELSISSAEGARIEAPKAPSRVGSGEGLSPFPAE